MHLTGNKQEIETLDGSVWCHRFGLFLDRVDTEKTGDSNGNFGVQYGGGASEAATTTTSFASLLDR